MHAIVTGGASGLGASIATRLLDTGHRVTVVDRSPVAASLSTKDDLSSCIVDVTDERAVSQAFAAAADQFGPPVHLVTCAGTIGQLTPAESCDVDNFRRLLDVHVIGTLLACRAFAGRAETDGASIVTTSSIIGTRGFTNQVDYGAAKAAVINTTQTLAMEWAPRGIRVNCVAPGYIEAGMTMSLLGRGFDPDAIASGVPMRRLGAADEVADAVIFLLHDARYTTGAVLPVDGGWSANGR